MHVEAPVPAQDSSPLLLLHGFGVPARTLSPLGRWLRASGWEVHAATIGWNVDCGEVTTAIVIDELEALRSRAGHPIAILGHSRGGLIGRVAAVRRPELVAGLVTVCTPWAIGPPERPGVAAVSTAVRFARRHGMRTMGSIDCDHGGCCASFRDDMHQVPEVPWVALWSSTDRIGGAAARPPMVGPVATRDVRTGHLGAVRSTAGRSAIGDALRALRLTSER